MLPECVYLAKERARLYNSHLDCLLEGNNEVDRVICIFVNSCNCPSF